MKISRIETFVLEVPLKEQTFWSSQCSFGKRKSLLVRVTTDEGLTGWGEGGQYGPAEPVASAVHVVFAPMLLGQSISDIEVHWERMYCATRDFGRGTTTEAISALDIAMWDILGKSMGLPVNRVMGGAFRDSVRTYATGLYYRGVELPDPGRDLAVLRDEAAGYVRAGFRAVKMKIGLFTPEQDAQRIRTVRDAIGEAVLLMVDANHAYAAHVACRMARLMEPYGVYWFEEPVLPEDRAGYRKVRASTSIAIAGGECEHTRFGFADLISGGMVDIAQPDPCCAGGLTETRRIAVLASTFGCQCIPHVWGSAVALAAGLQFLATLPPAPATAKPTAPYNEPMLEWDCNPNPLRTDLLLDPIVVEDGSVSVPTEPGLGIELDKDVLEKLTVSHHTS